MISPLPRSTISIVQKTQSSRVAQEMYSGRMSIVIFLVVVNICIVEVISSQVLRVLELCMRALRGASFTMQQQLAVDEMGSDLLCTITLILYQEIQNDIVLLESSNHDFGRKHKQLVGLGGSVNWTKPNYIQAESFACLIPADGSL